MSRPRTVNAKIKDLPRGMRKVGGAWYWRPTDAATNAVRDKLVDLGVGSRAGATPVEARKWWELHVSPRLAVLTPAEAIKGTVEELLRNYEAEVLPDFKRKTTQDEYATHIKRLRADLGTKRYPRNEAEAMHEGFLRDVTIQTYLHANREHPYAANRRISLLSRIFRLAKIRWGLTAYNPCESTEYLVEHARDVYVSDETFNQVADASADKLKLMAEISYQTGARIGSVYTLGLKQITAEGLVIHVGKKRNAKGFEERTYAWTPDLRATVDRALALRQAAPGTKEKKAPDGPLFLTKQGTAFTQEAYKSAWARVRKKLNIGARELTVHDLGRAKAISDSGSDLAGQELAGHEGVGVTRRHYRRKTAVVQPMPAVKRSKP